MDNEQASLQGKIGFYVLGFSGGFKDVELGVNMRQKA